MFPFIVDENCLILEELPLNPILPKADDFCCEVALGGTFSSFVEGIGDFMVDECVLLIPFIPEVDPEEPFELLLTLPFIDLLVPLRETNGDKWGLLVPPFYKLPLLGPLFVEEIFEVWLLFSFESLFILNASFKVGSCIIGGCLEVTCWLFRW
jgi:hypothetical protein